MGPVASRSRPATAIDEVERRQRAALGIARRGVEGITFIQFDDRDVVRHALVQRIVKAYDRYNEIIGANRQMSLKLRGVEAAQAPPPSPEPTESPSA